jgi:predicted SprT family Zn-dependent metalloprotease
MKKRVYMGNKMKRIIYLLAVLFVLTSCTKALPSDNHLRPLISFESGHAKTNNNVTYEVLEAEKQDYYANLILAEMAKYPDGFFDKIGLDTVVIGRNLKYKNGGRAAVPDNDSRILFLGIMNSYAESYIKHVFHHELNHYIEYYIWNTYYYDWDQWRVLYTGSDDGGVLAYQGGFGGTAYLFNSKLQGFLNTYSAFGQEEDRSEMLAYFLTENENKLFIEKARRDELFYQKAVTLFTFYKETLDFNLLDEFLQRVDNLNYSDLRHLISFERYTDTWNSVTYDFLEAEKHYYYSTLILEEMDKYPDGFFDRIGLDAVVIGKNLQFDNVYRAAVADNDSGILFVGIKYDYTDSNIKYSFHHEMNHYVEHSIWHDYNHDWDQWRKLYTGDSGLLTHQGRITNAQLDYRPDFPGFLNTYSRLDQAEDRSEMMAFFLIEGRNAWFIQKAQRDELFYQKAVTLFTFYKETLGFNLLDEFLLKVNQ